MSDGAKKKENPYIGYKFIKRNIKGVVKMELWQDDPNEKDPKKMWKKVSEYTVKK